MRSSSESRTTNPRELPSSRLGRGVGWASLALGAAQLVAPRALLGALGIAPTRRAARVVRLVGAAKLGTGLAVLLAPRRPLPLLVRAAYDVVDLGLIGLAGRHRGSLPRLAGTLAVGGIGALDAYAARRAARAAAARARTTMYAVTINKPPHEVYAFFRRFERLPTFMDYLDSVRVLDDVRSRWVARLPTGGTVTWEARITEDRPGEAIAWESVEGSRVDTCGRVTFARAPGRDMTEVRVELELGVAGAHPSAMLAKLFAKPQVKGDLRRLKQVLETGEVLVSDASEHRLPHPARPSRDVDRRARVFFPNPPAAAKGVTP